MEVIYSFNKEGPEASGWDRELAHASANGSRFIPFNHVGYLDPFEYSNAEKLNRLYQDRDQRLRRMYADLAGLISEHHADVLLVTNCPPYHPDFLRTLAVYKVLYTTDDPASTYLRTIPYLHAYQHVLYCSPTYSADMNMDQQMRYCRMRNADWLPLGVFDFEMDPAQTEEKIRDRPRPIDIVYVGSHFRQKLSVLAAVKKAFGSRFRLHGYFRFNDNVYFNVKHGYRGWVRRVSAQQRAALYLDSKLGFNLHWNQFGLGNQRLYHLPANGVMQLCDCAGTCGQVYRTGEEIVPYSGSDDLVDKLRYYLAHDEERRRIALQGWRRTMREYRIGRVLQRAAELIADGMRRIQW